MEKFKLEFLSDEFLLSKIEELKLQGFDQIRLPGGSSKDESHYSGVFIYGYNPENKQVYFVGVPYNSNHWKDNRSNGHTKKLDETALETGCREVFEETGFNIEEHDLNLVFNYSIPNRKDKLKVHTKNFYLCNYFTGNMHNFTGANLIDRETAAPLLLPLSIFKKVLYGGHQNALAQALDSLKNESLELYDALVNFLS